jgi:hypothetical protein
VSFFERALTSKKPGVWKVWGSAPVRLYSWHIADLYRAVSECSQYNPWSELRTEVNGKTIDITRPEWADDDWSPVQHLAYSPRFDKFRSIAFITPEVTLHLGPRSIYAYGTGDTADVRGALFRIERSLAQGTRQPGSFLLRTWGAAIGVAAAFCVGVFAFRPWDDSSRWSLLAAFAALAIYLGCALYVGCVRRVIIEPQTDRNGTGFWHRNADAITAGAVGTVIGGLLLSSLLALAGYWH